MRAMGHFEHVKLEPWASAGRNQYLQSPVHVGKHREDCRGCSAWGTLLSCKSRKTKDICIG